MLENLADLVARWRTPSPATNDPTAEHDACVLCNSPTREDAPVHPRRSLHPMRLPPCAQHLVPDSGFSPILTPSVKPAPQPPPIDPLAFPDGGDYQTHLAGGVPPHPRCMRPPSPAPARLVGGASCSFCSTSPSSAAAWAWWWASASPQAFEDATHRNLPVVSVVTSSGMRLREGLLRWGRWPKPSPPRNGTMNAGCLTSPCSGIPPRAASSPHSPTSPT